MDDKAADDANDDLPVLTQVLRIGSGGVRAMLAPAPNAAANEAALEAATHDASESPFDEILLTDRLVIGPDARRAIEPYVALTTPTIQPVVHDDARDDVPDAQLLMRTDTHVSMQPFTDPIDAQRPTDQAVERDTSSTPAPTGHERSLAANDANDVPEDAAAVLEAATELTDEPATDELATTESTTTESTTDESALVDASTPEPFDHDAFAVRVRESILNDLSARIDTELDARIAETLRAELEAALASLQGNLREQLADAMRDVVRRVVDDEVARLRETHSH